MGAWIETCFNFALIESFLSHPTWVRGLKQLLQRQHRHVHVAPYVGAWIETLLWLFVDAEEIVAPYVGAWIETMQDITLPPYLRSHPTWVRGLKLHRLIT